MLTTCSKTCNESQEYEMTNIPDTAIIIPADDPYIAVDINKSLEIYLLRAGVDDLKVAFDKKIVPHLVDALIELQNRPHQETC